MSRSRSSEARAALRPLAPLLALAVLLSCDDPPPETESTRDSLQAEQAELWRADAVLWIGCDAAASRNHCEIDDGEITVWVPGAADGMKWSLGGVPLEPLSVTRTHDFGRGPNSHSGTRFVLPVHVPEGGSTLAVSDDNDRERWSLPLIPYALEPSRLGYEVDRDRARAETDPATRHALGLALLDGIEARPPLERLARLRDARRLAFDPKDYAASFDRMEPLLVRVAETAASLGRWSEQCQAASVGAYFAEFNLDLEAAQRWQPWDEPCRARAARWQVELDSYFGALAIRRGDYEQAAQRLSRSRTNSVRLGMPRGTEVSLEYATLLCRTGRWSEAGRELAAIEQWPTDTCSAAMADSRIGFLRLRARERGLDIGDPRPVLLRALRKHQVGADCERLDTRDYDVLKLGFAALARGDANEARQRIASLDPRRLTGKFPPQYDELAAGVALLDADPNAARRAVASMAANLQRRPKVEAEMGWRLAMVQARVAEADDDAEAALAAYRRAEAVLDALRDDVHSGVTRDRWLTGYHQSALLLVERLVEAGALEDAACAARTARTRALVLEDTFDVASVRDLEHPHGCEHRWSRRPDELVILVVPRPDGTWRVFEILDDVVRRTSVASRLPTPGEPQSADWWNPWTASLERSKAVRILASEAALAVPFHALDWDGEPLASRRPVVYGLDLPPVTFERAAARRAHVAFADVDPLRTLDRYGPDVAQVAEALSQRGWSVGYDASGVDLRRVEAALASVSLFHYYGHGERRAPTPVTDALRPDDVGTTALLLDDDTSLEVDDVLELEQTPRWVVLLGCHVGFPDTHGWSGGLSLAHAFLLAGAQQVVASTEPLDAQAAAALGPQLYPPVMRDEHSTPFDLSVNLHKVWAAHAETETEHPQWQSLRVWSR